MRFHQLIILLLLITTGCMTQARTPEAAQPPLTASPTPEASTPPVAKPSGNRHSSSPSPRPQSSISTAEAILTVSGTNAEVNLRATPSVTSNRLGYGLAGDRVQIIKQAASTDGDDYIWYQVRFPRSGAIGWIREDFVRVRTSQIPSSPPDRAGSPTPKD